MPEDGSNLKQRYSNCKESKWECIIDMNGMIFVDKADDGWASRDRVKGSKVSIMLWQFYFIV